MMDHIYRTRPSFQHVVDKQRVAAHRLASETTRTQTEMGHYKRTLEPVGLGDVEVTKLPLVRCKNADDGRYLVLGEVAQIPGKLVLVNIATGEIRVNLTADDLELTPPLG